MFISPWIKNKLNDEKHLGFLSQKPISPLGLELSGLAALLAAGLAYFVSLDCWVRSHGARSDSVTAGVKEKNAWGFMDMSLSSCEHQIL